MSALVLTLCFISSLCSCVEWSGDRFVGTFKPRLTPAGLNRESLLNSTASSSAFCLLMPLQAERSTPRASAACCLEKPASWEGWPWRGGCCGPWGASSASWSCTFCVWTHRGVRRCAWSMWRPGRWGRAGEGVSFKLFIKYFQNFILYCQKHTFTKNFGLVSTVDVLK